MIKGALFDIDDTLYSHELHAVPKATLKALDKLRAKGIKIGICTSRVAAEMLEIPEELLGIFLKLKKLRQMICFLFSII